MIIDITGIELTPGNNGNDCLGNGEHYDANGNLIECCCDECNYLLCCIEEWKPSDCKSCCEFECPKNKNEQDFYVF